MRLLLVGGVSVVLFASGAGAAWLLGHNEHHTSSQRTELPGAVTVRLAKNKDLPADYPRPETSNASEAGVLTQPVTTATTQPVTTAPQPQSGESPTPQRRHGFEVNP